MGPDAKTSKEGSIPGYKIENISPKEKKKIVFACENISCNFSHKKKIFYQSMLLMKEFMKNNLI